MLFRSVVLFVAFDVTRFLLIDSTCEDVSFSPGSEGDAGNVIYSSGVDGRKEVGDLHSALESYLVLEGYAKGEIESEISRMQRDGELDNIVITQDYSGSIAMTATGHCTRVYSKILVDRFGNPLYKCVEIGNGCDGKPCFTLFGRDRVSSSMINLCVCS